MTTEKTIEILDKQLELLAEKSSEFTDIKDLVSVTYAINSVVSELRRVEIGY